ncbi:hypothetical protein GE061_011599 [Apolygus lucorum]|uniref:Fatty acid desaturase domain-containing protein n=1 Tax=Apolygus lucorum TaxID=248454 RepID=A0A8S9XZ47_APOLU|nr:hypothetical protein GE061_011599 [Apolygus lucorum]
MHRTIIDGVHQEPYKMIPVLSDSGTARLSSNIDDTTKRNTEYLHPLTTKKYKWKIVWRNVIAFIYLHIASLYGIYLAAVVCKWETIGFTMLFGLCTGYGITAGAHRLWAHKCYKANTALRLLLAFFNTAAFQNHIYEWARDHRVHHKFTDTDADPHNSRRGFFFSHMGWLMVKKQTDVKLKGQLVDMSDLEEDWVVMFQMKYYFILMPLCAFVIPIGIPMYFWGESLNVAFHCSAILRYTVSLNNTWLVNSAAHIWGNRPYDRTISPTENIYVGILAFGEGWHNYHHAFPWDYKTSEYSGYKTNISTAFIDFFSWLGWAYDLKTVRTEMIEKRALRTGDGTHHSIQAGPWGWGDPDLTKHDKETIDIINPKED